MYDHRWWLSRVVWAIEKSVLYAYIVLLPLVLLLCVVISVVSLCVTATACGSTTDYLDQIDCIYYAVRCCTMYERVFVYTCLLLCSVLKYGCCCSCCCLLLLLVIVCWMAKFVAVVHCMWFQCFLSLHSNTIYFQCTSWEYLLSHLQGRLVSYNTYHTSSVLRAYAEPRRALAAPHVNVCTDMLAMSQQSRSQI